MFGNLAGPSNAATYSDLQYDASFTREEMLKHSNNPRICERVAEMILETQIDKLILGLMFDAHRLLSACDTDTLARYFVALDEADSSSAAYTLNTSPHNGLDVFGKEYSSKQSSSKVECPICHKPNFDASKLSKHIGGHKNLQRQSFIMARKRIAATQAKDKDEEE